MIKDELERDLRSIQTTIKDAKLILAWAQKREKHLLEQMEKLTCEKS